MPELPEVETVMRGLMPYLEGAKLVHVEARRPNLRFPIPPGLRQSMQGQHIERLSRRAKYLLWHLGNQQIMLMHLGMSGRVLIDVDEPLNKHDHLIWRTQAGAEIRFRDPRRFGYVDLLDAQDYKASRHLAHLGPEPLSHEFDAGYLASKLVGKRTAIKTAILDQRLVVGVGNIYVCESLNMAGIDPARIAQTLSHSQIVALTQAIKAVLIRAIEVGGSSIKDHRQVDGTLGYFQHEWRVYGRETLPCKTCETPIQRLVQSARSTFFCPVCQA